MVHGKVTNAGEQTRVVLVDDHSLFREGLRKIISSDPAFNVVGEADNGRTGLELIEEKKPDIAVLDISMPDMNGIDLARALMRNNENGDSGPKIIFLTMFTQGDLLNEAISLGVSGYLLKENSSDDLLLALRSARNGKTFVSPVVSGYITERRKEMDDLEVKIPGISRLTPQERQILSMLARNRTSREIADTIHISHRTVQNHRANICEKLDLKGHNKLLELALEFRNLL